MLDGLPLNTRWTAGLGGSSIAPLDEGEVMVRDDDDDRAWLVEPLEDVGGSVGDAAELPDTDYLVFMGPGSSDRLLKLTREGK